MLRFNKPWVYVENGHCVNVPAGFKGEIPEKHAKDAVKGGYAVVEKTKEKRAK